MAGLRESVSGHLLFQIFTWPLLCRILLGVAAVQVTNFSSDVTDINSRDVIELMLITQVRSGIGLVGYVVPHPLWPLSVLSLPPLGSALLPAWRPFSPPADLSVWPSHNVAQKPFPISFH